MTVIATFARFAEDCAPPDAARSAAADCILDWYGCAIAGSVEMPATGLRRALPSGGPARLLPDGAGADPRTAALINGTASHTVEVDDIFRSGLYHPGVVTVPAALAAGEAAGVSGAGLLRAVIAGYEVGNRIARAVNPAHYLHWHTTATVGHFGAAVAASVALGLDAGRIAHAMANAATFAAGLRHAFSADGMSKPLHAGRAAEAGVLAALAAREGVTGIMDMLEGERGFGVSMSGEVDWAAAVATLGTEWTVTTMTQKAHACCGHNFAAIDAVALLMREHGFGADEIEAIDVGTYRAGVEICGNPDPRSAAEGRFSLPWCAAAMARAGAVTPAAFSDAALADPATRSLAARVSVAVDDEAEARFPHARSAVVTIRLKSGQTHSHRRPTRKGDPDDPLSEAEVGAKFAALAAPVIGSDGAADLQRTLSQLEQLPDIRAIPFGTRVINEYRSI
jgi:2-methylcitrate dehydratase PrpD